MYYGQQPAYTQQAAAGYVQPAMYQGGYAQPQQQWYPQQAAAQQQYYPQQQQQFYPQQQQYYPQQYGGSVEQYVAAPAPIVQTTQTALTPDAIKNYAPGTTAIPDAGSYQGGFEVLRHNVTVENAPKTELPAEGTVLGRTVTVNDAMQKLLDQMDLQMKMQADFEKKQQEWARRVKEDPIIISPSTPQEPVPRAVNTKVRIEEVAATQNMARAFVGEMKAQTFTAKPQHHSEGRPHASSSRGHHSTDVVK